MSWITSEATRLKNTIVWSWAGWRASWASEKTLRQWTLANGISAGVAFALDLEGLERAVIIGFGLMILVAELINTAVENVVDRVGLDDHDLSCKAKDAGSACVAMAALTAGIVWLVVLFG
jgi:diacylglycerol kinase (ATP)